MESGRTARVDAPLWWARLAVPGLGPREAEALAHLMDLGDAVLGPITAGDEALGILTVRASNLSDADLALAEILGRVAGVALDGLTDGGADAQV